MRVAEIVLEGRAERRTTPDGRTFVVLTNPNASEFDNLCARAPHQELKGWLSPDDRELLVWPSYYASHPEIRQPEAGWRSFALDRDSVVSEEIDGAVDLLKSRAVRRLFRQPFWVVGRAKALGIEGKPWGRALVDPHSVAIFKKEELSDRTEAPFSRI